MSLNEPDADVGAPPSEPPRPRFVKGASFWLSYVAVVASIFLSAMDLTAVSTALPTITKQLNGGDNFVWVGSAYALSSTAFLPLSGSLADIFWSQNGHARQYCLLRPRECISRSRYVPPSCPYT